MKDKKEVTIICVLLIVIPFFIHLLFKIEVNSYFFEAEWTAGELLGYIGTVILGGITVHLSQKANDINDRLLHLEKIQQMSYVTIDNVSIATRSSDFCVELCFNNTDLSIPITNFEIHKCTKLIDESIDMTEKMINEIKMSGGSYFENDYGKEYAIEFVCNDFGDYDNYVVVFKIKTTNIYGLDNFQCFNLYFLKDCFLGYKTIVNEKDIF